MWWSILPWVVSKALCDLVPCYFSTLILSFLYTIPPQLSWSCYSSHIQHAPVPGPSHSMCPLLESSSFRYLYGFSLLSLHLCSYVTLAERTFLIALSKALPSPCFIILPLFALFSLFCYHIIYLFVYCFLLLKCKLYKSRYLIFVDCYISQCLK